MRIFILRKFSNHLVSAIIAVAVFLCANAVLNTANAQLPATQHYSDIPYITGGFGLDESTAIKEAMPDYSLVFTFASSDKGRAVYVSNVQVVIRDSNDFTMFNAESDGPFLLAQMPAGNYIVHATYKNKTLSRTINVVANKSNRVVFDWPFEHETDIKPDAPAPDTPDDTKGAGDVIQDKGFIPGLGVNPRG